MTAITEIETKESMKSVNANSNMSERANNIDGEIEWLKKYRCPEWQKRSQIKDVFCLYGAYYS